MCLDAAAEKEIDPQILRWLSFARQKTEEVVTLATGLSRGTEAIASELAANRSALASRAHSPITRSPEVRACVAAVTGKDTRRPQPYEERSPHSGRTSACRCCRSPPSARSRRPRSCGLPAPT
ncbi:hypothetical protein ACFQ60_47855 [Streptomyces zhihengii]